MSVVCRPQVCNKFSSGFFCHFFTTMDDAKGKMCSLLMLLLLLSHIIDTSSTIHRQRVDNAQNSLKEMTAKSYPFKTTETNKWTKPIFDISIPNNVTALVGKSAYLTCRVRNLGNYTVSWIRHQDLLILTVATYTFTSDQRFQTTYHRDTDEWTLHIKWVQERDAGIYEAQISTQPIMSYFVQLNVIDVVNEHLFHPYNDQQSDDNVAVGEDTNLSESFMGIENQPTARILSGPDLYVDKGSTINLTCVIGADPEAPRYILWYHGDQMIGSDLTKEEVILRSRTEDTTTSYLIIYNAGVEDSGEYTCTPSNSAPSNRVRVHVFVNGEHIEAMHGVSSSLNVSHILFCSSMALISIALDAYSMLNIVATYIVNIEYWINLVVGQPSPSSYVQSGISKVAVQR